MLRSAASVAFLALCVSWSALAQSLRRADSGSIQAVENGLLGAASVRGEQVQRMQLADRMFAYHVTGVSIAVIHNGAVAWSRGFGVTRVGGATTTADTLFQAASISKPVTALAALRLAQAGKIDLDSDINRYLRSWKLPENRFTRGHKVTLRELLTHTAGTDVRGFPGYATSDPLPSLAQVLDGTPPANTPPIRVEMAPAEHWDYSGGGYVIVQQVLMDVTGESFPHLMRELVLAPVGMTPQYV